MTAMEADAEIYPWILKNVTSGVPYEYMDVPMGRKKFYEAMKVLFFSFWHKKDKNF